jgi:uncharacterized protein (TIGR03067 family)
MRSTVGCPTLIALVLVALAGLSWAEPNDGLSRLIQQLGDDEFAKREAASQALAAMGDQPLAALRQAAASTDDVEIRRRAEALIKAITDRAAAEEQKFLEGAWTILSQEENGRERPLDVRVVFRGGTGVGRDPAGLELFRCTWRVVDATTTPKKVDLIKPDGQTFRAIYALEGDTLKYCGSFERRPETFATRPGDGCCRALLKREVGKAILTASPLEE